MLQSRKYNLYALGTVLVCLGCMGLAAALDSAARLLAAQFAAPAAGWTEDMLRRPAAAADWLTAAGALLGALLLYKGGPRASLAAGAALGAVGCMALAACHSGAYILYLIGEYLLPVGAAGLRLGGFALCMNWFVRLRGRAMGAAALGGTVYLALGAGAIGQFIATRLSGVFTPLAGGAAAALGLLALAACLLRDEPEDIGMYPDGAGTPPAGETEEEPMPLGRALSQPRLWLALACLGALAAAAAGWTAFLAPRLMARHGGGDALVVQAGPWLALGAILALPAGYLFGWLCDSLGAMNGVRVLALGEMAAAALLWAFPKELGASEGILIALCEALLIGGGPVALPCAMAQVYGRRQVFSAGRVLFPALYLAAALMGPVGALLGGGARARLYIVLLALAGVGFLLSFFLRPEKK